MTKEIQFGIRVGVDGQTAVADLERIGAGAVNVATKVGEAGRVMASEFADGAAAVAKSANAVSSMAESESAATERIRAMVAASLQQSAAVTESARSVDNSATSTRRASDENLNYTRTLAAVTAQMAQPRATSQASSVASEESQKYIASLQRQYDLLGLNGAEQAQYQAKMMGGTKAVQSQAYALVSQTEALREQIAAEERGGQAAENFIAKLKEQTATLGMSRTELLSHKAAQLGVAEAAAPMIAKLAETGSGAKSAGGHVDGFSLSTVAARRELLVLAHELSQGNFQKFGGSMMVLGEQTGAASLLFSGTGLAVLGLGAAVAGVSYAMIKGASDQKHMDDALIMTGNYAGLTSDSLNQLAHTAVEAGGSIGEAKKVATELAASGKFTGDQISYITQATVAWEHATSKSVQSTIKEFESLAVQTSGSSTRATETISRATLKLDDTYHFLTEAVYEQIRALEKEGDAKGASALATATFAKSTSERAEEIVSKLGNIARAWHGIKEGIGEAVDALGDWGKRATPAADVKKYSLQLQRFDEGLAGSNERMGRAPGSMSADTEAARTKIVLQLTDAVDKLNKADTEANTQAASRLVQSTAEHAASRILADDTRLQKKGMTELQIALNAYADDVAKVRAANPDSALVTDEAVNAHIAALTKAHTATVKGNDDRAKLLQDGLLVQQTALEREKNIYDERDKMLGLYHSKMGMSDAEFYSGREAARAEYIAAEAISFASEKAMIDGFKANNPQEVAAAKEKYDALLKAHLNFIDKMKAQRTEDSLNQVAEAKKAFDEVIKATYASGTAEIKRLDDVIAKQREHNAEIGKTKDQIDLAKQAEVDKETIQLRSDADFIRNAIAKEGFDVEATQAYQLRLNLLDQEISKRGELSTLLASAAILDADAKAAKDASTAWAATVTNVKSTLADAIVNGGGTAWKKLKASIASQVLSVPITFLGNLASSIVNPTAAQAQGGAGNVLNAASSLSSAYNLATGTAFANIGNGISSVGSYFGSSTLAEFGSGFSGSASASALADALAGDTVATGLTSAASAGAGLASALSTAVPWIAAAGIAYKAWTTFFEDGPESDTRLTFASNNNAGAISINERGNEGKSDAYIGGSGKSELGTFGISSTFWSPVDTEVVQSFIKSVSQTDDALAAFMTTAEKASVSSFLTGKTDTAHTGAEGGNPNASGQLDKVFSNRISNILEGVSPGLSSLVAGFDGTSQALATEAAALLKYRAALKDSGQAVFGTEVTLQQVAALKTPTELTSAALTRVAAEFTATNQVAKLLGKDSAAAFGAVGLASESARAQLIQAAGGADALSSKTASFAQNYLSEAERLVPITKSVTEAMASLGLSNITSREQFKATALSLDVATEAGAKQYAAMMDLESAFAAVYPAIEGTAGALRSAGDIASERASLQKQLDQAMMSSAEKERAAIDDSNKALYDAVQARLAEKSAVEAQAQAIKDADAAAVATRQKNVDTARSALTAAYNAESAALKNTITQQEAFIKSIRAFGSSLLLGDASPLSPQKRYEEARRQFETAKPENLQNASTAFLEASKAYNASGVAYAADFAKVQKAIDNAAIAAKNEISVAKQSLSALDASVAGQIEIKDAVLSVRDALTAYLSAVAAAAKGSTKVASGAAPSVAGNSPWNGEGVLLASGDIWDSFSGMHLKGTFTAAQMANASRIDGSHKDGLEAVPFDGYHAVLHQDEGVIDAPAMAAIRRYFNASPSTKSGSDKTFEKRKKSEDVQGQSELLEELIGAVERGTANTAENIRGLKQHLAHVISKVAA